MNFLTSLPVEESVVDTVKTVFEDFTIESVLPDIGSILTDVVGLCRFAVLLGPALLLILGILYFFLSPKEANWYFGYRTYFGMGSVEAWQYAQHLAGVVLGGLGLVLTIAMVVISMTFSDPTEAVYTSVYCLIAELVLALLGNGVIMLLCFLKFDAKGRLKRK